MRRGAAWPWIIVGLLALGIGANVALLVLAHGDPSFAVEPNYYAKALAWDRVREQERRNRDLGWEVRIVTRPAARGRGWTEIAADLRDAGGRPLAGARVEIEAFHNARAGDVLHAVLAYAGTRGYVADLPIGRAGLWELRLRAARGTDVFTRVLQEDLEVAR